MSTKEINQRLQALTHEINEPKLREAMAYSLLAGGKRMRPLLLLASCEAVSGTYDKNAVDFACAVEMLHTYSLIHDDLPAMDNDDFRRGQPTCHKVYGEAMAILAGDALLSHAIEIMARICAESRYLKARFVAAMLVIIQAAGANGMVAGQVQDIAWENKQADEDALLSIQEHKTMALIAACTEAGGIIGGASPAMIGKLKHIGQCIGRAFQIKDDILDVTATMEQLGKPTGSDERNRKNTYVSVMGMEQAQAEHTRLSDEARKSVASLSLKSTRLQAMVEEIVKRKK